MEHLPGTEAQTKTKESLTLPPTSNKVRTIVQKVLFRAAFMSKCCRFGVLYTWKFSGKF